MSKSLDQAQRNILSEKTFELGNLVLVALVFGQFLNSKLIPLALVVGLVSFISFTYLALAIMKGGQK